MKRMLRRSVLLSCSYILLTSTVVFGAQTDGQIKVKEPRGNLVVNISTKDVELMYAAIRIASVAAMRGHKVSLLLRVGAISFALKNIDYPIFDTTIKRELKNFMKTGSTVIVGGGCLKLKGIPPRDLMEGVIVGNPDIVMGVLFRENTRILSY